MADTSFNGPHDEPVASPGRVIGQFIGAKATGIDPFAAKH
jgi:hypothetical protein